MNNFFELICILDNEDWNFGADPCWDNALCLERGSRRNQFLAMIAEFCLLRHRYSRSQAAAVMERNTTRLLASWCCVGLLRIIPFVWQPLSNASRGAATDQIYPNGFSEAKLLGLHRPESKRSHPSLATTL
jgi:hypothetical protein